MDNEMDLNSDMNLDIDTDNPSHLGLHPSDPLNLLIHSRDDEWSPADSQPEWSQLSSLWPSNDYPSMKYQELSFDFNVPLPIDMDFNPDSAINPSTLHFDYNQSAYPSDYDQSAPLSNQMPFPFTFSQTPPHFPDENAKPRRLSVTSSSSSSGASLSPILDCSDSARSINDGADELADRVRKSAGVMVAVSGGPAQQFSIPPINLQPKPIRQKRPTPPAKSPPSSSATSSPGPDGVDPMAPAPATSVMGRPKTSHTTIERRYRTNLNARIQSLRQAVPALRVLEEKAKGTDVVDERGFVDGVKVARKGSKANVLGKAVEYIRVLKKREARLKREQNGLKSLLCGLVGGPALLKEWEQEWRDKFGGEETDEVEGEEVEPLSDDEEGDDEEGDGGDEGEGRARKKAKVVKPQKKEKKVTLAPAPSGDVSSAVPEKRKRGRPRKAQATETAVVSAGEVSPMTLSPADLLPPDQGRPAHQYLLATFALFSLFNSPLTSSSTAQHSHSGSVLGHTPIQPSMTPPPMYGWRDAVQVFHVVVSALVFFSIVIPWLPRSSYFLSPLSSLLRGSHSKSAVKVAGGIGRAAVDRALNSRGTKDEAEKLRSALGVSTGFVGIVQGLTRGGDANQRQQEQKAWVRLGELVALDGTTSFLTRLQTYWFMSSHISSSTASTSDLATLALIIHPLSSSKASLLWSDALLKTELVRPFERLVFDHMTVDDAIKRIGRSNVESKRGLAPLGFLASMLIRERVRDHALSLFVRTVLPDQVSEEDVEEEEEERTFDAAKSLGGRTSELAKLLENVWKSEFCDVDDVVRDSDLETADEVEGEIRSVLSALVLYRQIFPLSVPYLLSPPPLPSPPRNNTDVSLGLKRALASRVYEGCDLLEDARDHVVDMLFDLEHAGRVNL